MVQSILIVENLRFSRAIVRRMVADIGDCRIDEATDGQVALDVLAAGQKYDVIISDISMPGISGLELLKKIRSGQTGARPNTPFIIVSGTITDPVRQTLVALDTDAIFIKPMRKAQMTEALERIDDKATASFNPIKANYPAVNIEGVQRRESQAASATDLTLDDVAGRVRFLETVPSLEHLNPGDLQALSELAERRNFPQQSDIDMSEIADNHLYIIISGEAEVVRRTWSSPDQSIEHNIGLMEAGDVLGISSFMSESGLAEHSRYRTTRATDMLVINFSQVDNDPKFTAFRDRVKLSVSQNLAHRLSFRDEAYAENLSQRLKEIEIKRTAGSFVLMMACSLAVYTLAVRLLLDLKLSSEARGIDTVVVILAAFVPFLISVRNGPFKYADFGVTFRGAVASLSDALFFSAIFLAVLVALKWVVVTFLPSTGSASVFELARTFVRLDADGQVNWSFYALNVGVYVLFAPIQEVIVRCGLQCLIREFLYGSDRYRTIVSILASNIIFAGAHAHLNVGIALATFVGGLFFGWLFHRHRSLVGVSAAHILIGGVALFALGLESFLK